MKLAQSLRFTPDLVLPGFAYDPPPYGGLRFRAFTDTPANEAFDAFASRVASAVGRTYLPIYRMADGEFLFLVGERELTTTGLAMSPARLARRLVRGGLSRVWGPRTRTCWGEEYARRERGDALRRMEHALRRVADAGILAPYFALRPDGWGDAYFEPVCQWLEEHGIGLSERNYVPFYAVYALLNGPRRRELFEGRDVLVVTHLTEERRQAITAGLCAEGVASVRFLPVSSGRAMFDVLPLTALPSRVDLALVAAGIGSVNVIDQLRSLSVPCIDCGISLECMIDPDRRWERPFLIDDERVEPGTARALRRF